MKTPEVFLLSALCIVIFNCVLTDAEPSIATETTVIRVDEGSAAILKCRVANLSSHTVSWTFVTHDLPIFRGLKLLTNDPVKYSIISPLDTQSYDLQLLTVEASDHGFYKCAIDGTDKSVTIHLQVIGKPSIPFNPIPLNRTDCCIAAGVSSSCLPTCFPAILDFQSFDFVGNCVDNSDTDLINLIKCLTVDSNHDNCCLFRGIDPLCLPFCHNEVPEILTDEHENLCLNQASITSFVQCFTIGFETLPSIPQDVTVIPVTTNQASSLLVTWAPPDKNPDKVTGYKIMYKRDDQSKFFSHVVKDTNARKQRLAGVNIVANMGYDVHVAALADQGTSYGSVEISVFIPDESLNEKQNQLISDCCKNRGISNSCNSQLCRSRTWAHFDFDSLRDCLPSLDDIFACLVGEQNHTSCCQTFGVIPVCQPICSGSPPAYDDSLIICIQQFGTIEACVQQGHDELPAPPNNITLLDVTSKSAQLFFEKPTNSVEILQYIVQMHEGTLHEEKLFTSIMTLNGDSQGVFLDNLSPNTYYSVRIISEAQVNSETFASLPSETVSFLTYSANFEQPTPPPVVNVPHDIKACCVGKGMPEICSNGCQYVNNITAYFKSVLDHCVMHIGSVLSCAADGRDHSSCCSGRGGITNPVCLDLCKITKDGPISGQIAKNCIEATSQAINCFIEGVVYLPRHPDVSVTSVTWNTISLEWEQPKTSGLIDTYIIAYHIEFESQITTETTSKTVFILNKLKPATAYVITVSSMNENGTSVPSPPIIQYTMAENIQFPNFTRPVTGIQLWSNISHCCTSGDIPSECVDLCLNKQITTPDKTDESCIQHSHNLLSCYADGQDHRACCSQKPELPEVCHAICSGHVHDLNPHIASCMSYANRAAILSCFLENADLIPEAPRKLAVKVKDANTVQVVWLKPDDFCGTDCTSTIIYWKINEEDPDDISIQTLRNKESPYDVKNLDTQSLYTFAVRVETIYGSSPPSNRQTIFVSAFKKDVKVSLQSLNPYVEIGENVILQCATIEFNPDDPYTIQWFFNNGREIEPLGSDNHLLYLQNVSARNDEGNYSCVVTDSIVSSTDSFFLPIKYAPTGSQVKEETAPPGVGQQAKVACWFHGYPDTGSNQWMKDGVPLATDLTKYSPAVDVRYHTGITSYRLKIANVVKADYGIYSMKVSNSFGETECHVELKDPNDITDITPAPKPTNVTDCCEKGGVTELCQVICGFDIDIEEILDDSSYISCLFFFDTFITCGADGRDHTLCCKNKGINPYCFPFCAGISPGSVTSNQEELLQCVSETSEIFSCLQSGHKLLPFAPQNIILSWWSSGKGIMVRWSKPLHNFDLVEHYVIFFKAEGGTYQKVILNEHIFEHEISVDDRKKSYSVYMTANNKWGASKGTEIAHIEGIAVVRPSTVDVSVNGIVATLTWDNSPSSSSAFDSYNVYYKRINSAHYVKRSDIKQSIYVISDLGEKADYVAYVTTQSKRGYESEPSIHKQFRTGEKDTTSKSDDGGRNDNVAIGVGVVIAIFAIAAIIFLVIYLVKSRRLQKSGSDAVHFENPGYGNQGNVKIQGISSSSTTDDFSYGRLDEERTYDNIVEGTESGAYENPTYTSDENKDSNVATLPVNSDA